MMIIISILSMGLIAAFLAVVLSFAYLKLKVEDDPRVAEVFELLPGSNCGACGCASCHDCAEKMVKGEVVVTACLPGGEEVAAKLSEVLGVEKGEFIKKVAVVHCGAKEADRVKTFEYQGLKSCQGLNLIKNGNLLCGYGCLGQGDCIASCPFDAIKLVEGLPQVDLLKCTGCGNCITACPKGIISLEEMKADKLYAVACSSKDKGAVVRKACKVGCIGCKLCEKQASDYFKVEDFLAQTTKSYIGEDETALQNASQKCPTKCILSLD